MSGCCLGTILPYQGRMLCTKERWTEDRFPQGEQFLLWLWSCSANILWVLKIKFIALKVSHRRIVTYIFVSKGLNNKKIHSSDENIKFLFL